MVHKVSFILLVVGGLNWLLVGMVGINLVEMFLGTGMLTRAVYVLVGLSAVYELFTHRKNCTACNAPKI